MTCPQHIALPAVIVVSLLCPACISATSTIDRQPLPEWASFFTPEKYEHFLGLVRNYFKKKGVGITIEDGLVTVQDPGAEEQVLYGLTNLAQICYQSDPNGWRTLIAQHFDGMRASEAERQELEQKIQNFSQVSDIIAVRLWPADYVNLIGAEHIIYREDLKGTVSVLVFDLPHSIRQVMPEDATHWSKDRQELFEVGLQNVRRISVPEVARIEAAHSIEIIFLSDESHLVTTHALLLDSHPECLGEGGALVGVPNRHTLLCFPINDLSVVNAIYALIPVMNGLYVDGPGSISPFLYWYHEGKFTNLPYEINDENLVLTLVFTPPEEFVELLNSLQ